MQADDIEDYVRLESAKPFSCHLSSLMMFFVCLSGLSAVFDVITLGHRNLLQ